MHTFSPPHAIEMLLLVTFDAVVASKFFDFQSPSMLSLRGPEMEERGDRLPPIRQDPVRPQPARHIS